jgi:PAS domain S-box-containing protein
MPPRDVPKSHSLDRARQFELLAQNLTEYAVYMLDPDGFVTTWNAGARQIKGYDEHDIVGEHYSRFFSYEDQRRGLPLSILSTVREKGRYETEGWRVRKNGDRFWAQSVIEPIRDENHEFVGYGAVTRDVTERQEERRQLIESERRFRLLVDSVVDYAIFMIDTSGIITNWNAGAARIKGASADEVIGTHFSRFYTKEDRARGLPTVALETARIEGKYETEGWRVRKDGGRFWASVVIEAVRDETGELIGFAKITRDITERRSAQDAIRESERQFRLLVSAVVDYAIFMLDPNGIVVSWNAGAEKIKGYMANEIIGSHFSRFYTEDDRKSGIPARALFAANHDGRFEGEGWRVRKDGTRFWAHVVLDAIRDETGVLVGYAKITRDITERRETQLALERAQDQLAHAQKMEALGQLTGGIAHDFNNLLTILVGQARMLKTRNLDAQSIKAIEGIEATVQRGASLTRQLLGFSRRQRLDPQSVVLSERLPGLQTLLSASLPKNVSLLVNVTPDIWPVMADPNELELAIMNVVINARDALPDGGTITINAENIPASGREAETDFIAINIADTGVGIPPDILGKVFDPFFTTKSFGKGTGLGLSQVYGFTHQSGGMVTIESEVGIGTTVRMSLPRAEKGKSSRDLPPKHEIQRKAGRILVIEDNPDVTEVTAALLGQLGYTVRLAPNAETAMRALEEQTYDVVFSDIMMPGKMDGFEFAQLIRRTYPALPIVLASGSHKRLEEAQAHFPTVQKPYGIEEVDRILQDQLRSAAEIPKNLVDLQDAKRLRAAKSDKP